MTIQVKATEQYFPVELCIMLYKVVTQMKAIERYFTMVLFLFNILQTEKKLEILSV